MKDQDKATDAYWKKRLSANAYAVCRQKATEAPFSGQLYNEKRAGSYYCACCATKLFESNHKFDSGTGWPSFFNSVSNEVIREQEDTSHGLRRIEILCANCDSHLGHVFPDGPEPTGLRYCVNSLSLDFKAD